MRTMGKYRKVERAEWIYLESDGDNPRCRLVKCSRCGMEQEQGPARRIKWCNNCGAWMQPGWPEGSFEMKEGDNHE